MNKEDEILSEEEKQHELEEWEAEYAERQAEWYQDNIGEI